jgi:hypothetical protein
VILAPKRPGEAVRYVFDWSHQIGDDTIASFTLTRAAGTVNTASSGSDAQSVWAILSGGADGQTSTFSLVIVTLGGQTLIRDVSLLVSSTAIAVWPSTTTKQQVLEMAFEEIGLAGYEFDATAEEQASALRRLDALMAQWAGPGMNLDFGYNFPTRVGLSDPTDASGVPDLALDAVQITLAQSIMPAIGKTMSPETRVRLGQSMNSIRAAMATIPNRQLPPSTMRGAGNKPSSTFWPYNGNGLG